MKIVIIIFRTLIFALLATLLPAIIVAFYFSDIDIGIGLNLFQSVHTLLVGVAFIVIGLFFRIWATFSFYRHRLVVLRLTAQSGFITSGPYRFTRSPHYIGITLIFIGCAFLVGSYVALLATVPLVIIWNVLLRRYEEPKLERAFREQYKTYSGSVPRWFSWKQTSVTAFLFIIFIPLIVFSLAFAICPDTQSDVTDNYEIVNGMKVFYQTAGEENETPLIFLHGWGARHDDTCGMGRKAVIVQLAKNYNVFAVELPGFIRSEPPKSIWDMEEYAEFLQSFILNRNIKKPIIMGQSFGGGVATTYAGMYPDAVSHLILVDATQGGRTPNFYYQLRFQWKPIFHWIIENKIVPLGFKQTVVSLYLGVPQEEITRENIWSYNVMSDVETRYSVKTNYSALPMPVLLVWGEEDVYVTPLQRAKEIALEIPNANLFIIPNAGHLALYTETEEVVQKIVSFLFDDKQF